MDLKLMRSLFFVILLAGCLHAQIMEQIFMTAPTTSIPGPYNVDVIDWSAGTNAGTPTNTTLCASFFPGAACPSGASFTVTNGASEITYSNAQTYLWPAFSLTGGAWANTSTVSGSFAMGTNNNHVVFNYPTAVQGTVSKCTPHYTNWPQTTTSISRVDFDDLVQSSSLFNTMQLSNAGTSTGITTECGGTVTGGNCTGGEGTNGNMPTSTWQIFCHIVNNATGTSYSAVWNAPTSGSPLTTGTLVTNSLVTNNSSTTGGTSTASLLFGSGTGSGGGPSTFSTWSGAAVFCGLNATQTSCGFPAAPFLQLLSPSDSPGSGNYTSNQTVTATNPSTATDSIYYTTCTTVGCTPSTPTTSSTLYSGSFTATPPEAISYIATRTGNQSSAVTTSTYVQPNASFVGASRIITSGVTTANALVAITISSFTGTSGTLTFTNSGTNLLTAGETVALSGFTGGNTGLNGQSVTVLSASLSTTVFEATVTGSGYSSGTGTATPNIPSGDIIVCGNGNSSNGISACTDSHSDTYTCGSITPDWGNGDVEICGAKAGATVTTVSCNQTSAGATINCLVSWYSPGTLAGTVDQTAGNNNASGSTWTTTATSTLGGSADLVVGMWQSCCGYNFNADRRQHATHPLHRNVSMRFAG